MPKASVKRLINKKKDQLINFVLDIEQYPQFIPFCENSKVYEKTENNEQINIVADLTIGKGPFIDTFKSDVTFKKKKDEITVKNIGGPLKYLSNNWKFTEMENMTEVYFEIDFEIKKAKSYQDLLNLLPKEIKDILQKECERRIGLNPSELSFSAQNSPRFLFRQTLFPSYISTFLKKNFQYFEHTQRISLGC